MFLEYLYERLEALEREKKHHFYTVMHPNAVAMDEAKEKFDWYSREIKRIQKIIQVERKRLYG